MRPPFGSVPLGHRKIRVAAYVHCVHCVHLHGTQPACKDNSVAHACTCVRQIVPCVHLDRNLDYVQNRYICWAENIL